jgi:hypothetical protein
LPARYFYQNLEIRIFKNTRIQSFQNKKISRESKCLSACKIHPKYGEWGLRVAEDQERDIALSVVRIRVARWFIFKPKFPIWVNFGGP